MSRKKDGRKLPEGDDGRTIADMSGIERPNIFGFAPIIKAVNAGREKKEKDENDTASDRPWEDRSMNRAETGRYIFGALGAGLLIVLIFIGAAALLIALLLLFWK